MKGQFLFLGTGASAGIPLIGCDCAVCTSSSPHNKRLRPSAFVKIGGKAFLIDCGPDFRQQALRHHINHIDGLLLTHTHYDHIAGIDDLRVFYFLMKRPIPCLLSKESFESLKTRYHYLLQPLGEATSMSAQLAFHLLQEDFGKVVFEGVELGFMSFFQGEMKVTGYRFGDFAYVSDIHDYDEAIFTSLKGVRKLVVSALRDTPSRVHFSIEEAIAFARKVGAEKTWLMHIAHFVDHEKTERTLPPDVRLGYDGLEINF